MGHMCTRPPLWLRRLPQRNGGVQLQSVLASLLRMGKAWPREPMPWPPAAGPRMCTASVGQ